MNENNFCKKEQIQYWKIQIQKRMTKFVLFFTLSERQIRSMGSQLNISTFIWRSMQLKQHELYEIRHPYFFNLILNKSIKSFSITNRKMKSINSQISNENDQCFSVRIYKLVNIMLSGFQDHHQRLDDDSNSTLMHNYQFKWLLQSIATDNQFTLLETAQNQTKILYKEQSNQQNERKLYAILRKTTGFITVTCYSLVHRNELRILEKNMAQVLQKINILLNSSIINFKIFIDSQKRALAIQFFIYPSLILQSSNKQVSLSFSILLKDCIIALASVQQILEKGKKQLQARIASQLIKFKEAFEENRLRREKSTKICLLTPHGQPFLEKYVMGYRQEIRKSSVIARQLYAKYKERKEKLDADGSDPLRKFRALLEKTKNKDNFDSENHHKEQVKKKSPLLKPIIIYNQKTIQDLKPGSFGLVKKSECLYEQLETCNMDSQKLIERYLHQNKMQNEKEIKTGIFVKKEPIQSKYGEISFKTELNCLSYLRNQECPHVAEYYLSFDYKSNEDELNNPSKFKNSKFLFSRYYQCGFQDFQNTNSEQRLKIIIDLIQGIRSLIQCQIVHRDIKPDNLRLTKRGRIKMIDFGSACTSFGQPRFDLEFNKSGRCGYTPAYTLKYSQANIFEMSQQQYSRHVYYDLYAYGKIAQNYMSENKGDSKTIVENLRYIWQKCMQHNPEDRLNPLQILVYLKTILKHASMG